MGIEQLLCEKRQRAHHSFSPASSFLSLSKWFASISFSSLSLISFFLCVPGFSFTFAHCPKEFNVQLDSRRSPFNGFQLFVSCEPEKQRKQDTHTHTEQGKQHDRFFPASIRTHRGKRVDTNNSKSMVNGSVSNQQQRT